MISFTDYSKINQNYCIGYFGHSNEYLVQLRLLRPIIEKNYPGLELYLGCRDQVFDMFEGENKIFKLSEIKVAKRRFAQLKEIRFNGFTHPIEDFMKETEIQDYSIDQLSNGDKTAKAVVVTRGNYPTMPLLSRQIELLKREAYKEGFFVEVDTNIEDAGLVVGVESVQLFEAAAKGIEVRLVPTGVGTDLFQKIFPNSKILHEIAGIH